VSGLSTNYILFRHVLPRISGVVFVQGSLLAAGALGAQVGLAFLGLIVPNPAPSWGGMVDDGSNVLLVHPWLVWPPGIAIGLTTLAFCFLGDILRDTSTESWSGPTTLRSSRPSVSTAPRQSVAPLSAALLSVAGLTVSFNDGRTTVIEDVTFSVSKGEAVGIVGESGSGKSITTKAIIGLLPAGGRVESGAIVFDGRDVLALSERSLEEVRGRQIGFVTQEPMSSLDPSFRIGSQVSEAVRRQLGLARQQARQRTLELLSGVHLADPSGVAVKYPHELSGGMLQRVAIARALAGEPKLLIADEPTSALDASIRSEILDLLDELRSSREMAILLVTHDWGVVAGLCDRVEVMYAGELVEEGDALAVFDTPLHPYTEALLRSDPRGVSGDDWLQAIPGTIPSPDNWPRGCHFAPRCSYATDACRAAEVALVEAAPARETRCIHFDQVMV
jgi:peptide/nickel transport system permease protein